MWTQSAVIACGVLLAAVAMPAIGAAGSGDAALVCGMAADKAEGTILAVDMDSKSFTLHTKSGDVEVRTSDKTVFTLDGKESTMAAAIKSGRKATVEHKDRTAIRVDVTST